MLLVTDIGNTNTNIGIFEGDKLLKVYSVSTNIERTKDEYGILISSILEKNSSAKKIQSAIISSVVPSIEETIKNALLDYINVKACSVSYKSKLPVNIKLDEPKEAGADRLANASAAAVMYKLPAIVIDIGTATTFDIIDGNRNFLGGIIAAGPYIQAKALSKFTSKLPKLKIEAPKSFIGKNTIDAMLSGTVFGHEKMVEGMIIKCEEELGQKATIIGTGGFSEILFGKLSRPFDYINKNLTLEGARIIFELNNGGRL